ncbi:MAG TPA: NUDIX domain-containing protein [Propionicimonas sp.]|nr:NUDIX domain-containing protein [Propionicimonas sp.]
MTGRGTGASHPADDAAYARLRADAIARLTAWTPPDATDDAQVALRDEMVRHLQAHPEAMARTGPPAHFTASVLVLDHDLTSVLLTHHRRARAWFQFGGHYEEGDASVWDAAAREAREESGLESLTVLPDIVHLDRHSLVGDFGRCREHLDIRFAAVAAVDGRHAVSDESLDVRWWPIDSLPDGTREELAPLVEAAVRLIRRR